MRSIPLGWSPVHHGTHHSHAHWCACFLLCGRKLEQAERTNTENAIKATGLQSMPVSSLRPRCYLLNPKRRQAQHWLQGTTFPIIPWIPRCPGCGSLRVKCATVTKTEPTNKCLTWFCFEQCEQVLLFCGFASSFIVPRHHLQHLSCGRWKTDAAVRLNAQKMCLSLMRLQQGIR